MRISRRDFVRSAVAAAGQQPQEKQRRGHASSSRWQSMEVPRSSRYPMNAI